ncbi:tetratricopeptide repeat protein 23 isoform X7 [Mus musculus]|uniref:Tetratricopeptide repeat domain 23 n=3 Tax=Mus musculus TaxID=10090 RepID=E9QKU9_MOUSE|nr:tetratricopeptide repeat protein 23 isoform 2 [Mus musculus]NP_001347582.1 tetratricopeptide repeat protein 23 isoform 2 [Mus musculus]XP_030098772.1 tetratricopeptide repeat protein 23 isoform X7 [Mus musculus]XP_030098773.1 tetratricopeptide repeat protein 23 isoform X7 [Mus musculus]XP_030098774.1 tetratricopeptide repeat protein 23 isoform X7 [Mus musculus]XP_030098775.1 tetratricopeptide repeat protein 23 isoform X7 [Mus musculus]XP_030098776.1 tetratricopeptide repeat protein 23 isof|eukprot:NP_001161947.1 tetratricopeptide repeat protein 23 isoform 2 [Mus musculus]
MQESQDTHMSSHLDEVVAAVSVTSKNRIPNKLLQTALFQPPREKLHLCEERAKSYSSSREYKQAIQELVRCVALTRICYGDWHWKLAEAYVNLAQGYLQLKGLSLQAKQHAEKAKEILANSIESPCHNKTDIFKCSLELFYTLGRALLSLQKFKDASENLIKAERLSKEMLQCGNIVKEEWIEIQSRIKLSFAQLYQGQKRSKEAFPFYQKALEYTEITKDEKSLECVQVLRELAGVEQALGLYAAAISHFSRAHLIILSKDPSPEEAADSAHFIARAAAASGMHDHRDVAEKYFQESMTSIKDSEGAERAKFLSIQDEFCSFLQTTGQKERAAMILRESLEAKVGAFGDFSPEVAETYRALGRADLAQGNNSGAYAKLKKCVQIETFLYGSQDKKTLATQHTIDTLSKISEAAGKSRQSVKAKVAFCTSAPQYGMPGKGRHSVAD